MNRDARHERKTQLMTERAELMMQNLLGLWHETCMVWRVPMTDNRQSYRSQAGTSLTKAVAMQCRGQVCPVSIIWNKHQTGPGYQA